MNRLATLAEWAASLEFDSLPTTTIQKCRECLLDYLGAAIAGSTSEIARAAYRAFPPEYCGDGTPVIGTDLTSGTETAALLNGLSGHALEIDDYYVVRFPFGHPGTVIFPACISCLSGQTNDRQLIAAAVAGYEVAIRVADALGPSHYRLGWHSTGTIGTFGAAAAACRMLGADPKETLAALGLAGTQAAGLIESFSAWGKPLHAGRAAANGVAAALLATRGFQGSPTILEGELGLGVVASQSFNSKELDDGLGEGFRIEQTSFKKYFCACFDAVDAALEAEARFGLREPDRIQRIEIGTIFDFARNQRGRVPGSMTAAKVSTEYCVATALLTGKIDLNSFTDVGALEARKLALMNKVDVVVDPRVEELFQLGNYAVSIKVNYDGDERELLLENTRGHFLNPLSSEELGNKFDHVTQGFPAASDLGAATMRMGSGEGSAAFIAALRSVGQEAR